MTQNGLIVSLMAVLFLIFGYLGVPVAFSLIAGVVIGTLFTPVSLPSIIAQLFNGIDAEPLMAVPFFLLIGELMTSANVVVRIANLSQALVGHVRGGLAQVDRRIVSRRHSARAYDRLWADDLLLLLWPRWVSPAALVIREFRRSDQGRRVAADDPDHPAGRYHDRLVRAARGRGRRHRLYPRRRHPAAQFRAFAQPAA
jgi:hypothetical protein